MSASSYRLEASRPRPPPLPIRTHNLSGRSASLSSSREATHALLYDVSSASPMSPTRAISPSRTSGITSPTSPTYSARSRARGRGMTPPPSSRARSVTPSQPARSDVEDFAEHCRAWYYDQNDRAGQIMTQTLATLPPSQRAPFARLQASIRSAYHASVNARRNAEFQAHLAATNPGGSLMPHSRADPSGPLAKKERFDRLERFVRTWCTVGMPGTKPFFEALWAVMRLQVIPEHLGGAGGYRIEWEIDDAVFKEAAGKDFMLDAIDVLKGVRTPTNRRSPSLTSPGPYSAFSPLSTIHSRSQSQPLPAALSAPPASRNGPRNIATPTAANLDFSDLNSYMRTWIAPDLPNHEYVTLLTVFPSFITQKTLPRFPLPETSRRAADIEEGQEMQTDSKRIRVGTGTMWLGLKPRTRGWQGSWWTKFKLWLQRIFC
ncbi:hypothetical protein B0H21DRAFT_727597 [Amylocystis lapponica]|nr:hypothetical protein B0H21DRAFT_727597 [Amylocystis lapponica]